MLKTLDVVAAIIEKDDKILLAQRPEHADQPGQHHKQRHHEPSHLTECERERELKVVDCINDFFHAPYACIAFDFLDRKSVV